MILIADSGSSKCDWVVCHENEQVLRVRTKGLNPSILSKKELKLILKKATELETLKDQVKSIHFFGAGCNTKKNQKVVRDLMSTFFSNAESIYIKEDMMAAVWSVANFNSHCVVGILGTGSNSCFFDGEKIHKKVPSLGYLLMDEGSGNYFGKQLLRSYYYNRMPEDLKFSFKKSFNLKESKIMKKLYSSKTPNRYLSEYAPFLFENKEHPFIQNLLKTGIKEYIENHILQYKEELETAPLYFIGTIAFLAQDVIDKTLAGHGLKAANYIRRPIHNLIDYIREQEVLNSV